MGAIRLILGDQLSETLPSLDGVADDDLIVMAECVEETTYTPHHKQKIILVLSAMRHFANTLRKQGHTVRYFQLDDSDSVSSLHEAVQKALKKHKADEIILTEPGEYRLWQLIEDLESSTQLPVTVLTDTRFFCDRETFSEWVGDKKKPLMENFYRKMRRETGYLMENEKEPLGGQWNFDKDNRKSFKDKPTIPPLKTFKPDAITQSVIEMVQDRFSEHFGHATPFQYAVTRKDALKALDHFIEHRLPLFGDYQDAMWTDEPFLFHSILSPYLNCGLLLAKEVIEAAEAAYHDGHAPLNSVEGFIRQILGWREFIRGIYWHYMPDYAESNFLEATRALPSFYWDPSQTKMKCVSSVVAMTEAHAYSHHIQRLMVTGNFAILAGLVPKAVCEWYLAVYCDAYEWVELPNTHGMALHADGGIVGTKPYVSSGAYINKMSNYCKNCHYDVKAKTGSHACPFNYLYWDFIARHRTTFSKNPRMTLVVKSYEKMAPEQKKAIKDSADDFLNNMT